MAASLQIIKNTLILSAQYCVDNRDRVLLALRKNQGCVAFRHSQSKPGKIIMMRITAGKLEQLIWGSIAAIDSAHIPNSILYLEGEDTLKVVTYIVSTSWQHTLLRLAEKLKLNRCYVFDSSFHLSQGIFVRLSSIEGFFTVDFNDSNKKYLVGASYEQTVRVWYITDRENPKKYKHSSELKQGSIASVAELERLLKTFKLSDEAKICISLEGTLVSFAYKNIKSCASTKIMGSGFWGKGAMVASTYPTLEGLVSNFTKI